MRKREILWKPQYTIEMRNVKLGIDEKCRALYGVDKEKTKPKFELIYLKKYERPYFILNTIVFVYFFA